PNNSRLFFDATDKVSICSLLGPAKVITTKIDRQKWFEKMHGVKVSIPVAESRLPYVPLDALLAHREIVIRAVEAPMVANIVVKYPRPSASLGTDNDIVHMGFLLPSKNGLVFRHASKRAGQVVDRDFFKYLESFKTRPEIIGVNFLEINGKEILTDR
ncbi:MAG: DUF1460 domain-containing protein, partial [Holophagales bacterium]|nr:DUF1460 domain-containing protein [Holophagales bacterium]